MNYSIKFYIVGAFSLAVLACCSVQATIDDSEQYTVKRLGRLFNSPDIANDQRYSNFNDDKMGGTISFSVANDRVAFLMRQNTTIAALAIAAIGGLCAVLSTIAVPALYVQWRAPVSERAPCALGALLFPYSFAKEYDSAKDLYEQQLAARTLFLSSNAYKWSTVIGYSLGACLLVYTAYWLKWCYTTRHDKARHFPGCNFKNNKQSYTVTYTKKPS